MTADTKLDAPKKQSVATRAFRLGQKNGREQMLDEIAKALGIDERIAKAIAVYEEQRYDR